MRTIFNDPYLARKKLKKADIGIDALSKLMNELFQDVKTYEDERAFVLVCAILVENALDMYLFSYIPGYDEIRKLREITFSTKIEIAKSLQLSPIDKLNAIDIIRDIRNIFAHQIPIKNLDDLEESKIMSLKDNLKKFLVRGKKSVEYNSVKEIFGSLVENVTKMLVLYSYHIDLLNLYIRSDEVYRHLNKFYEKK